MILRIASYRTFHDILCIIYHNGTFIQGYDFSQSLAVRDDKFVGLAIDEENQPDLTDYRIKKWLESIAKELVD